MKAMNSYLFFLYGYSFDKVSTLDSDTNWTIQAHKKKTPSKIWTKYNWENVYFTSDTAQKLPLKDGEKKIVGKNRNSLWGIFFIGAH